MTSPERRRVTGRWRALAVGLCVLLAACGSARPPGSAPAGSPPPSPAASFAPSAPAILSIPVARIATAVPARREAAAIEAAFGPEAAAELATALPADIDWPAEGIVCVYLGRREEGGWGLAIQSATLTGGELAIQARETRPAPGVERLGPEFPADCAVIARSPLPVGVIQARADDTISDEFIVAGELTIPPP